MRVFSIEYFILQEDEKIINPLRLEEYTLKNSLLEEDIVIKVATNNTTKNVDYIKKRFLFETKHIISESIRDTIHLYIETLEYKGIFATEKEFSKQYIYWEVDYKSIKNITLSDTKLIKNCTLPKAKIIGEVFFCVSHEKQNYLVVREDVAESILRRNPMGIKFTKIVVC